MSFHRYSGSSYCLRSFTQDIFAKIDLHETRKEASISVVRKKGIVTSIIKRHARSAPGKKQRKRCMKTVRFIFQQLPSGV